MLSAVSSLTRCIQKPQGGLLVRTVVCLPENIMLSVAINYTAFGRFRHSLSVTDVFIHRLIYYVFICALFKDTDRIWLNRDMFSVTVGPNMCVFVWLCVFLIGTMRHADSSPYLWSRRYMYVNNIHPKIQFLPYSKHTALPLHIRIW
jgi:hypothetical protein